MPSIPDWGINKVYLESDRRQWFVTCPKCNLRQPLDFWENVDLETATRVCSKSRNSI